MSNENPEVKDNENTTPPPADEGTKPPENTDDKADDEGGNEADKGTEDKGGDDNSNNVDLDNPDEVSKALNQKGVDYNALTEEYATTGKISDESIAKLEAAGIPREMVDNYIKGYEARAKVEKDELVAVVGGEDNFKKIIDWAAMNLKREEIISLNNIRDKFELEMALIGLQAKMEKQEGINPNYQRGDGDKPALTGYRSKAEMYAAIRDPKYKVDEAYRADVTKKIAASREAGIDLGIY